MRKGLAIFRWPFLPLIKAENTKKCNSVQMDISYVQSTIIVK